MKPPVMSAPRSLCAALTLLPLLAPAAPAQERGALFERVVEVLGQSFYDKEFRAAELPELARRFGPAARAAGTLDEERAVVHEMLENVPVSHLGLMSTYGRDLMWKELGGEPVWTFGLQLVELDGGWFVDWVYEGGPAQKVGLLRGDEVLSIEGDPPAASGRVDWRTDDCALPDPAIHALRAGEGEVLEMVVRRGDGRRGRVTLPAERYSSWEAAQQSVAVHEDGPFRVGYVHLWFIHLSGTARFLRGLCSTDFADCDAMVLDLRGRGGAAHEALRIVKDFDAREGVWRKPLVLLVDAGTRSAKEVISYELQRTESALVVGERTAGAVIPATFSEVGSETVLMFPAFTLGQHTRAIEGVGVTPDIAVGYPLPWSAGDDPVRGAGLAAARVWCEELAATH